MRRRLLVAIHDVTPAHAEALRQIYALLERLGITRYALLVVPDWHGAWPLERHPAFVDDLLARQAAGVEIFCHGYRHDEAGTRRTLMQHVRVAGRTAAEAEFRIIPPDEAERRLDRGLELFRQLGIAPVVHSASLATRRGRAGAAARAGAPLHGRVLVDHARGGRGGALCTGALMEQRRAVALATHGAHRNPAVLRAVDPAGRAGGYTSAGHSDSCYRLVSGKDSRGFVPVPPTDDVR